MIERYLDPVGPSLHFGLRRHLQRRVLEWAEALERIFEDLQTMPKPPSTPSPSSTSQLHFRLESACRRILVPYSWTRRSCCRKKRSSFRLAETLSPALRRLVLAVIFFLLPHHDSAVDACGWRRKPPHHRDMDKMDYHRRWNQRARELTRD